MKVLFLDFDGPLNTWPLQNSGMSETAQFNKDACMNLEFLLNKIPELEIVVSSAWRHKGIGFVKRVLRHNGIDPRRIIGLTGFEVLDGQSNRGNQIQCWLDRNPEVEKFAVIDDEVQDMKKLVDDGKVVKIDRYTGLTQANVDKLIEMLQ